MFMNFPFFYNKNPLLIKSRKHQRHGENRYLKTFLGSPKPFIWTSCSSVSSLSSFKSESPNPDLYGIRSVQLKQTDSPDHEMWNAFARLIPGSSKTYKSPPFSWRNNIRFPRQCLTSGSQTTFFYWLCPTNQQTYWTPRTVRGGGLSSRERKNKVQWWKVNIRKMLVIETFLF